MHNTLNCRVQLLIFNDDNRPDDVLQFCRNMYQEQLSLHHNKVVGWTDVPVQLMSKYISPEG